MPTDQETEATRLPKKWSGLAKPANPSLLYLPQKCGGLGLVPISLLYKRLHVSSQCQLLRTVDPVVRHLATKHLQAEDQAKRHSFRPSVVVRDSWQVDPSMSRRALPFKTKREVAETDAKDRLAGLQNLQKQGDMIRSTTPVSAEVWAEVVNHLPPELLKFSLNAAMDTLPHNANLHLWRKKTSASCLLCLGDSKNLIHVLNSCDVARGLRRYNARHDDVLALLYEFLCNHLPAGMCSTAGLNSNYSFPLHIVSTDLRPDIVVWCDSLKKLWLVELTVCFDTLFEEATARKQLNYRDLTLAAEEAGYASSIITVEVGSRGMPNIDRFENLKHQFVLSKHEVHSLMMSLCAQAIRGSFAVWCSRNRATQLTLNLHCTYFSLICLFVTTCTCTCMLFC